MLTVVSSVETLTRVFSLVVTLVTVVGSTYSVEMIVVGSEDSVVTLMSVVDTVVASGCEAVAVIVTGGKTVT